MCSEDSLSEIISKAQSFYQQLDPWHDLSHGKRVVKLALRINKGEGGDPFLVEAGAWLHQYHDHLTELEQLLSALGLPDSQKTALYEIVEQCRPLKISQNSSLEACIVFDADALELVGPSGVFREVLCNSVFRKMEPSQAIAAAREVQELFVAKIQTKTARSLAESAIRASDYFWDEYEKWESAL